MCLQSPWAGQPRGALWAEVLVSRRALGEPASTARGSEHSGFSIKLEQSSCPERLGQDTTEK